MMYAVTHTNGLYYPFQSFCDAIRFLRRVSRSHGYYGACLMRGRTQIAHVDVTFTHNAIHETIERETVTDGPLAALDCTHAQIRMARTLLDLPFQDDIVISPSALDAVRERLSAQRAYERDFYA